MMDPLQSAMRIAGSGMGAQSTRLRVISENIANAQSVGDTPGASPYLRKVVTFDSEMDRAQGVDVVQARTSGLRTQPFRMEHDPSSPAADENGYVKMPNIDVLVELADMREANRTYEANVQVAKQSAEMMSLTVNLLKDA